MTNLANGLPIRAELPPLRVDEGGAVRVDKSRVNRDLVVEQYETGLLATTNEQSIGSAIDDILLIAEFMPEEEIRSQVVVFLPFRA